MIERAGRAGCAMVLIAVLLGGMAAPASATGGRVPIECGVTPTADAILLEDLECPTALRIPFDGPEIDVDLNGHTFAVPPCSGLYCAAIIGGTSVHDGRVVGPVVNVELLERVHVVGRVDLGTYVSIVDSPLRVTHSLIEGDVVLRMSDVTVDANLVRGDVVVDDTNVATHRIAITGNWVVGGEIRVHPLPFTDWDVSGEVSRNLVLGAPGDGISIRPNGNSIGPMDLVGNVVVRSGGDGIVITANPFVVGLDPPPAPVRLEGNLAIANAGHGIVDRSDPATSGVVVIDGGGNRAFANGTRPPCVGVVCSRWHR